MLERLKALFRKKPMEIIPFATTESRDINFLGESAERMLENAAFEAAIRRLKEDYFTIWCNSKPLDTEGREAIWRETRAINEVRIRINGLVNQMIAERNAADEAKNNR